jgi:hypothetical protein
MLYQQNLADMVIDALKRERMSPDFVREFITALALLPGAETAANTNTFKLERRLP